MTGARIFVEIRFESDVRAVPLTPNELINSTCWLLRNQDFY